MKEYCVYWFENGEPRHEVFSCLDGAEMFSCMIRGQDGVEHVEISEEDIKGRARGSHGKSENVIHVSAVVH